jgi:ABC-type antimicrobial peptide transport system permease subunit
LIDLPPLGADTNYSPVFASETADLRPANAIAQAILYSVSPGYFRAASTALLSGRAFTWRDDQNAQRVAVINREFARKVFGSLKNALYRYYKLPDGTRVQVVGIVENGKYGSLTEDSQPAVFSSILQSPASATSLVARSNRDPKQVAAAMRGKLRDLDAGLPCYIQTWYEALDIALFGSRMATLSLGVLGVLGAMLSITGIFGIAAYSVSKRLKELGIRMALGAQRKEVLQAALGRAFKLLALGSAAGLVLGILASRVLASIVYQATPRDPLVLGAVVVAMGTLGLLATWIPAQRALSLEPSSLLREE